MKINDIKHDGNFYSPWKALYLEKEIDLLRSGEVLFPPRNLQVDLEGWCPHSCEFCTYRNVGWQDLGMDFEEPEKLVPEESGLPRSVALKIPREMHEAGIPSIELTRGGEPMAYPHLPEFLDELNKYNIELSIVTNGASLKESIQGRLKNLKWIRFSVDGARRVRGFTASIVHVKNFPVGRSRASSTILGITTTMCLLTDPARITLTSYPLRLCQKAQSCSAYVYL